MDKLLVEPPDIRNGTLHLSTRPGLGIEVDLEVMRRFELPRDSPLPAGNYADLVSGGESYVPVSTKADHQLP